MKNGKRNTVVLLALCFTVLVVSVIIGVFVGAVQISPTELISDMAAAGLSESERIVLYLRIPRIIASVLAGGALAVAGAIIQAVLGNELAAPNIIGVNSGAGLFYVVCAALFPSFVHILPAAAFLGALFAAAAVYFVSKRCGASRGTVILTGVAISSLLNAFIDTVTALFPDSVIGITAFKAGGVAGINIKALFPAWIFITVGIVVAIAFSHDLDVLSLGEDTARGLGMNVPTVRFIMICVSAMLAGAAVSFSGLIGFVGLVVPHISRRIAGTNENRTVIPVCALAGGAFLTLCDTAARSIFAPYELPLGITVSYIGVPFFIWLLFREGRHRL